VREGVGVEDKRARAYHEWCMRRSVVVARQLRRSKGKGNVVVRTGLRRPDWPLIEEPL